MKYLLFIVIALLSWSTMAKPGELVMPQYGDTSLRRLESCHKDIQAVFHKVIQRVDCSILEGARATERQKQLYAEGRSKLDGVILISKHQIGPDLRNLSEATDVIPYPTTLHGKNIWTDEFRFTLFAGEVLATGWELGVELRWGGDWDGDGSKTNQSFHDLPHYELIT